jgi:3-oxoadipate enol-lactonase
MTKFDTNTPIIREGSGEPLVLLHCLGVDHHFWDFARPLASEYTLYRYDLPGHGTSAVPVEGYEIEDLADQLHAIVRAENLARINLAGISLGGLIAQCFAARHPDLVARTILIDTTPRYTPEMRRMWAERAATARTDGTPALIDGLLKIWFSAGAIARNDPGVAYVRAALARCSGEGYAKACEALARGDLETLAPQIKSPTLVVCGDDDIPSFLDAARWLAGNVPGAELAWIAGTRHASVLEKPQDGVALMRGFLGKI